MFLGGQKLLSTQSDVYGRAVLMEYPLFMRCLSGRLRLLSSLGRHRTSPRNSALRGLTWRTVYTDTIQCNKNFCKTVIYFSTRRTGEADLLFYIITVEDG